MRTCTAGAGTQSTVMAARSLQSPSVTCSVMATEPTPGQTKLASAAVGLVMVPVVVVQA
jgi:hypothetical protein